MLICSAVNDMIHNRFNQAPRIKIIQSGPAVKLRSGTFDGPYRFVADLVGAVLRDRFTDTKMFVTGWQNGCYVILTEDGVLRYSPWLIENVCYLDTELDKEIAAPLN